VSGVAGPSCEPGVPSRPSAGQLREAEARRLGLGLAAGAQAVPTCESAFFWVVVLGFPWALTHACGYLADLYRTGFK